MAINLTANEIVFNSSGKVLTRAVRKCLRLASESVLTYSGCKNKDVTAATTKKHSELIFTKYVRECILTSNQIKLDKEFIKTVFSIHQSLGASLNDENFHRVTGSEKGGKFKFGTSLRRLLHPGFGCVLVALHSVGAITLPAMFKWPYPQKLGRQRIEVSTNLSSEIVKLIRSAGDTDAKNSALNGVEHLQSRIQWFLTYGSRLILATGWNTTDDIKLEDLLTLKQVNAKTGFLGLADVLAFRALADVIGKAYGEKTNVSVFAWDAAVRRITAETQRVISTTKSSSAEMSANCCTSKFSLAPKLELLRAADATPKRLGLRDELPGLKQKLGKLSRVWVILQTAYLNKLRREDTASHVRALGHLNLYLFFYLPFWFQDNQHTPIKFPDCPTKLAAGVFVTRLLNTQGRLPKTLMDHLSEYASAKKWKNDNLRLQIHNIRLFFDFLEQYSDELPGCANFKQPFSSHDYPTSAKPMGTNKRPIPRRVFSLYLKYLECLIAVSQVVTEKILNGELDDSDIAKITEHENIINFHQVSETIGFFPVIFLNGKIIPLPYLQNCLDIHPCKLKDGRYLSIPQPHGLIHTLVAVYTGIRGNHIQWLDVRSFDSKVLPEDSVYSTLFVNTDKVKLAPWMPHVNSRVLSALQYQKHWRSFIDPAITVQEPFYGHNEKSKWGRIATLFACKPDGSPHPDERYRETWRSLLAGVQGISREAGFTNLKLFAMLPSSVSFDALDKDSLLSGYAESKAKTIYLEYKSDITPHSARSGIVSHLIQVLPADAIGENITGQDANAVYHYVYLDADEIRNLHIQQTKALRLKAIERELDGLLDAKHAPAEGRIQADKDISPFRRSILSDVEATIHSHGCISLSTFETSRVGIDVLKSTRGANAAFNKTELCPFGNHCPPDIIKAFDGKRRCALCPYAVRSVDHLDALQARICQVRDQLNFVELRVEQSNEYGFTETELQELEGERQWIASELAGWKVSSEVLERRRLEIAAGRSSLKWVVERPEIIARALERVIAPSGEVAFLLSRLNDCIAFPTTEGPQDRARFDLLRRQLLANVGDVRASLYAIPAANSAAQCVGMLRAIAESNNLSKRELISMMEADTLAGEDVGIALIGHKTREAQ